MRQSILFRLSCDPVCRVCSGVNAVIIPADAIEPAPAMYLGGGNLVSVPDLEQIINGTASRIAITVSGVSADTLRLALEDAPSVKGARVDIGTVMFDDDWQIVEVEWVGQLRADTLTTDSKSSQGGRTRSITLSISTEDTDRSHAPVSFWTHADQQRRSPGDNFFDHIAGISSGTSRRFGPSD